MTAGGLRRRMQLASALRRWSLPPSICTAAQQAQQTPRPGDASRWRWPRRRWGVVRDEVQRLIEEENAQLVEVLPPAEYEDEHIVCAINIPLRKIDLESTGALDPGRPVIVH